MDYQNTLSAVWGLLVIIFTTISSIAIHQAIQFIKSKHAEHLAIQVVLFVEDMFGSLGGQEKLEKAIHFLGEKLRKIPGFKKITDAEIESLIRAAYQKVFGLVKQDMAATTTDKVAKLKIQDAIINDVGTTSSKIGSVDTNSITGSLETVQNADIKNADSAEAPKETEQTPDPEPAQEPVQEVEKPIAEMTSTDLKNLVNQAVKEQLQTATATPVTAQ